MEVYLKNYFAYSKIRVHAINVTCGISSNFFHVRLDGMYENRHTVVLQKAHTLELENYVKLKYP